MPVLRSAPARRVGLQMNGYVANDLPGFAYLRRLAQVDGPASGWHAPTRLSDGQSGRPEPQVKSGDLETDCTGKLDHAQRVALLNCCPWRPSSKATVGRLEEAENRPALADTQRSGDLLEDVPE